VDEARRQTAIDTMRSFRMDERWLEAVDDDSPEWLRDLMATYVRIYSSGDLDALLAESHPEIEIVQPAEFPDRQTYRGHRGVVANLLDWPREWKDFHVEPNRIWEAGDGVFLIDATHSGRSLRMGIEVEVQIFWLFAFEDGLMRSWRMFTSLDEAQEAARS
jgi:ketosteroid isomerase-like protein